LTHSQVDRAVMFPTVNLHTRKVSKLDEDDIWGALALYDTDELDVGASCQISPALSTSTMDHRSIFGLILSMLF
jgi:hypothetical protein